MSGQLRTEADVMMATAGRVDNTNAEVQSELARLRGIVDGIRGSWAGAAQVSFDNLMQRWDASAGKLRMALQSISDNIRSNAASFDQIRAQITVRCIIHGQIVNTINFISVSAQYYALWLPMKDDGKHHLSTTKSLRGAHPCDNHAESLPAASTRKAQAGGDSLSPSATTGRESKSAKPSQLKPSQPASGSGTSY